MKKLNLIFPLFSLFLLKTGASGFPESGVYVTRQYEAAQIKTEFDVPYGEKTNQAGEGKQLQIDFFIPPNARVIPQPLVVVIHGGGFRNGTKEQFRELAAEYATYGFVAATINYRLTPEELRDASPEHFITAATQATEDGMDAIRFLKLNASKYGIDPDKIATIGSSAGGWISVINGLDYDAFNGSKSSYPGVSSKVNAVIATGVSFADNDTCKRVRGMLSFDRSDSPLLLFHAETRDKVTSAPWLEAVYLSKCIRDSGNACELYPQPGDRHTDKMNPGGNYWGQIGPFLWKHLDLTNR